MASDTESHSLTLPPVVKEYETLIEAFTIQLDFYAKEQDNLKNEITSLITENQRLNKNFKETFDLRTNFRHETENELIENLKTQISLISNEKEVITELWQNSLKNTDYLEEQLNLYQGRTHGYLSNTEVTKLRLQYERQLQEVQMQVTNCREALNKNLKESADCLSSKNSELEKALKAQTEAHNFSAALENEMKQLRVKLKSTIKDKGELEGALKVQRRVAEELRVKESEAKIKVTEAVQVVEAAFREKDAALLREKEAKDEVTNISKNFSVVLDETTQKVKTEVEKIKAGCNLKLDKAQKSIEILQQTITTKNIQLEKATNECKLLETELERFKKGNITLDESNTSKLLILEKNLESTFQKLLLSERKGLQLSAEKESIKADMEQMANCYESDIKAREIEKRVLKTEIQSLRKQLKMSNTNLIHVTSEIEKLNKKFHDFDDQVRTKIKSKEQSFQEALRLITDRNKTVRKNLETQLEFHVKLNKKWRTEMNEVLNKLENQMNELRNVNKSVQQELKKVLNDNLHVKRSLKDICTDVKDVVNVNKNNLNTYNF